MVASVLLERLHREKVVLLLSDVAEKPQNLGSQRDRRFKCQIAGGNLQARLGQVPLGQPTALLDDVAVPVETIL